jgi:hypothetical protein
MTARTSAREFVDVYCVARELLERHFGERLLVCRGKDDLRGDPRLQGLAPAGHAQAPAVAGTQSRKVKLRVWSNEVVSLLQ